MHTFRIIVSFLFVFFATSYAWPSANANFLELRRPKGNDTERHGGKKHGGEDQSGDPTKKECRKMERLEGITKLASNQTKLDELVSKGKLTSAMVDEIKAKAANATTELQTLSANSTLVAECATVDAAMKTEHECREIKRLKKLSSLANNQTAIDAIASKKGLNSTQVDHFKEMIQKAGEKYQKLSSNSTLTDMCSKEQSQHDQQKGTSSGGSSGSSSAKTASAASGLSAPGSLFVSVLGLSAVVAVLL